MLSVSFSVESVLPVSIGTVCPRIVDSVIFGIIHRRVSLLSVSLRYGIVNNFGAFIATIGTVGIGVGRYRFRRYRYRQYR